MTTDTVRSRMRPLLTYAGVFVLVVIALVTVLPAGRNITAAPQAASVGAVDGPGAECLGERVATVQSGVFIDLHVPANADDLGPKIVGGRIDRETGQGELTGTCAQGSDLDDRQQATYVVTVYEDGEVSGEIQVGGRSLAASIVADEAGEARADEAEGLEGAELVARILMAVAVVMVAARILGSLFGRINQPRVIGEIVAGILLGPSLVGLLFPQVTSYLFPPEVIAILQVLAQFGLIFFMFLIGLELDHRMIRGSGHLAVLISHMSIVVPFVLGLAAALILYPIVGSGNFTGFALFMGASMAITAFPVLARILTDTGLHRTRLGALAITCAAVDDVTAWCILAVVVAIVKATGVMDAVQTVVLAVGFVLVMLVAVRPLLRRVAAVHEYRGRLGATIMSGLIVGLFLSAWATEAIGIHAIFGAFMFGAILPRSRGIITQVTERLEDVTVLFLLPVFFAVVGLSTRIGLVSGTQLWLLAGLIVAIAIAGKLGGSIIAGRAAGESWRSSTAIGILMNARGLTEIVILTIGASLGVISPALFTMMVMMALVTTFMTTPLLAVVYPRQLIDRELTTETTVEMLAISAGERRVMVGVTDPVNAQPLVRLLTWLRGPDETKVHAILASVVPPPGHEQVRANLADLDETATAAAEGLEEVRRQLEAEGIDVDVDTAIGTDPSSELARLARRRRVGLILVGSHEAYLGYRPLGGVAGDLLRDAPSDVAVLVGMDSHREEPPGPVGVWYRGEPPDLAPLDLAASLARGRGEGMRVISPVPVEIPQLGVEVELVVLSEPTVARALDAVEGTSIMVVAPPGVLDGALPALREAVIERASVPVLVVRARSQATLPHPVEEVAAR